MNIKNKLAASNESALKYFTANRFDLAAKLIYLRYLDNPRSSDFGQRLYVRHVEVMNGLFESDGSKKIGRDGFINSFNNVYESIKQKGFDSEFPIPVSDEGAIEDGAHRLSSSIFLGKSVYTISAACLTLKLDYKYFKDRGLDSVYLDEMALEYLRYFDDIRLAILWPTAGKKNAQNIEEELEKNGDIIYKKEVNLENNGPILLVKEVYSGEEWLGSYDDGFVGASNKAAWCFSKKGPVIVYLYKSNADLVALKEEIRGKIGEGKHSIHITDTHEETLRLARTFFNINSLHWLNVAKIKSFKWFNELLSTYKKFLYSSLRDSESFCLDGSSVLAAYGVREPRDLDFIHDSDDHVDTGYKEIGDHNMELRFHPYGKLNIIYDPDKYFYYEGVKIVSLDVILKQKKNRNEEKDKEDLLLVSRLLEDDRGALTMIATLIGQLKWRVIKSRVKFYLLKARYYFTKLRLYFGR